MAKNWVVSISPVSPYQRPMPHSSGERVERARRVLVEADDERDLGRARGEHARAPWSAPSRLSRSRS